MIDLERELAPLVEHAPAPPGFEHIRRRAAQRRRRERGLMVAAVLASAAVISLVVVLRSSGAVVSTGATTPTTLQSYSRCNTDDVTIFNQEAFVHLITSIAAVAEVEITDPARGHFCQPATSEVDVLHWDIGGDARTHIVVSEPGTTRELARIGIGHRALLLLSDVGQVSAVRWQVEWELEIEPDGTLHYGGADPLGQPWPALIRQATAGTNQVDRFVAWIRQHRGSG